MFTAPTFQAPELARLVTRPSRHGSGSGDGGLRRAGLRRRRDALIVSWCNGIFPCYKPGRQGSGKLRDSPSAPPWCPALELHRASPGAWPRSPSAPLRGVADASAACCAHGRRCADNARHTAPGAWPCQQTVKVPALACPLLHLCINVQISEN